MLTVTIKRTHVEKVEDKRWKQCRTEAGDEATEHCKYGETFGYVVGVENVKRDDEVFRVVLEEQDGTILAQLIRVIAQVATEA